MPKIFLIVILSLLIVWPLFKGGFYSSHDGLTHVVRFARFDQALRDGQFPPRWASGIAFNLGSPVLMYNAPLPYFTAEIFRDLGGSYVDSIKWTLILSVTLSGIAFYLWGASVFSPWAGFLGALIYIFAPYRYVDIYVRGAFPESFTFIFPPLLFLATKNIIENYQKRWFLLGVLSLAGLILSHNVMALLFLGVDLIYAAIILYLDKFKSTLRVALMVVMALLISAIYWIPAFFEKSFVNLDKLNSSDSFLTNFIPIKQIIYSKWGWGPLGSTSPMSLQLGIGQWLGIGLGLVILLLVVLKRIKVTKIQLLHPVYFGILFLISIFLMSSQSKFLWEHISLLSFFLHPWRFLALATVSAAIITAFAASVFKENKILIVIFVLILIYANRNYNQFVGLQTGADKYYFNYSGTTDIWGEFLPKDANLSVVAKCKETNCIFKKIIAPDKVIISNLLERSNDIKFSYQSKDDFGVTLNSYYFPGWNVYLDSKKINTTVNKNGTMDLLLPGGDHRVDARFENTPLRGVSQYISILGLILLVFFIWRKKPLF